MRASKEMAEKARQDLAFVSEQCEKLSMDYGKQGGSRVNASDNRKLSAALESIGEFLNVAQRKLPTEAAFDRDAVRRSAKA